MKLFVTGGTGFIGRHVLEQLGRGGHEVVALCRGEMPADLPGVRWLQVPMDELQPGHFDGVQALVHLASVGISPRVASWDECFHWNVAAMIRLVRQAHAAGVRRVVAAGTFAEYGRSADAFDTIPPDAPLLPTNAYAASKAAGFMALSALSAELQLELAYLRIFSAFGEGQHASNFWPSLRAAALAGQDFEMTPGEQVRDYIPVEDVAAAFVEAALRPGLPAGLPTAENVGTGRPVTMRAFAEHWWRVWGATGRLLVGAKPYRPNEPMRFVARLTPARPAPASR